jgi:hypothetical protein
MSLPQALCGLAVWIFAPATTAGAPHGQAAITCTNPYSGATWQIHVDYERSTVDSSPAEINEATIAWQAENGWKYTLDRKSGKLTVILASATGGNFLYDQCKLGQ